MALYLEYVGTVNGLVLGSQDDSGLAAMVPRRNGPLVGGLRRLAQPRNFDEPHFALAPVLYAWRSCGYRRSAGDAGHGDATAKTHAPSTAGTGAKSASIGLRMRYEGKSIHVDVHFSVLSAISCRSLFCMRELAWLGVLLCT